MKKADIEEFFARLKEQRPEPRTELEYTTAFELLIAVLLSAQSTDVGVNKATANSTLLRIRLRQFSLWDWMG